MTKLTEFADAEEQARYQENQSIKRDLRTVRRELRDAQTELDTARRMLGVYEALDAAHTDPPKWRVPAANGKKHHGVLCKALSDIHWGAKIKAEEVNGMNAYDEARALARLRYTFESTVKVARNYFSGVVYDGLHLFLPGDMHSGEIHDELRQTNALAITDSIMSLADPLAAGIDMLAKEFGHVKVSCVVGNHGRRTRKPLSKGRVQDNYDYLTYRILARDFAKRPDISIDIAKSTDAIAEVYDTRYLLTHGDQFRGGGGISAELAPLLLGVHRKLRRDAAVGRPFDVMVMGHFHRTLFLPTNSLIVCGSLMGYDEYAFQSNFRPERPQSLLWITTPENGITLSSPIFACRKGEEAK